MSIFVLFCLFCLFMIHLRDMEGKKEHWVLKSGSLCSLSTHFLHFLDSFQKFWLLMFFYHFCFAHKKQHIFSCHCPLANIWPAGTGQYDAKACICTGP